MASDDLRIEIRRWTFHNFFDHTKFVRIYEQILSFPAVSHSTEGKEALSGYGSGSSAIEALEECIELYQPRQP